jgi:hypothetical protein
MEGLDIRLSYFEDGHMESRDCKENALDRWELHGSHFLTVNMAGKTIELIQQVQHPRDPIISKKYSQTNTEARAYTHAHLRT